MANASTWCVCFFNPPRLQSRTRRYSLTPVQLAWRYFVAASNIATDLLIIAQILVLIINIQTSISHRLTFFGIFAPRIL
jgi:hypothetical protein